MNEGHVAVGGALARLYAPAVSAGLLLGRDSERAPVVVRLFRDQPTRVALVGGWWTARLLVFRALALGARVVVRTTAAPQWNGLGEAATGRGDRLHVFGGDQPVELPAGRAQPALHVYDVGLGGAAVRPTLGPWHTQLTLLPRLTAHGRQVLDEADVVLAQRMDPDEIAVASQALGLDVETGKLLSVLYDDMLGLLGAGTDRYVWVEPTQVEQQTLGAPNARR